MGKMRLLLQVMAASVLIAVWTFASSAAVRAATAPGYVLIDPAPPAPSGNRGKVEVVEFFSYGCPHCAALEPYVSQWERGIDPARVEFHRVHATYSPLMLWLARGFYTGEVLGVTADVHAAVFREIHEKGFPLEKRTVEDLASLYSRTGVDSDEFLQVAQADKVEALLKEADRRQRLYKVDRTPTLIVAGKYRVTAESAGGPDRIFAVVDELIRRETAARPRRTH
jgi:thiol:disulfide interchange protein DsbA